MSGLLVDSPKTSDAYMSEVLEGALRALEPVDLLMKSEPSASSEEVDREKLTDVAQWLMSPRLEISPQTLCFSGPLASKGSRRSSFENQARSCSCSTTLLGSVWSGWSHSEEGSEQVGMIRRPRREQVLSLSIHTMQARIAILPSIR
jgi:hypothetical protein